MRVPETVTITVENEKYEISKYVFECYKQMHPVRTEDSLHHDISKFIIYDGLGVNPSRIEAMIMEEYNYMSKMNLPELIAKARKQYSDTV